MNSFIQYCSKKSCNPWKANLPVILDYLTHLFKNNLSYNSINLARSALSLFLPKVDQFSVGCHPLVVKLMKAIFRANPPSAKYSNTWSVDKVLNMLECWPDNEHLSIEQLSMKLVGLLALTTAQRVQTLAAICVNEINLGDVTTIDVHSMLKTTRPNALNNRIALRSFKEKPKLCVVSCLKTYLFRTLACRKGYSLLIANKAPYENVTTQTISRWLRKLLDLAGVDSCFGSHSFRHASVSKAFKKDVPIDTIFKAAGWSSSSKMFARHYNRIILEPDCTYSNSILMK